MNDEETACPDPPLLERILRGRAPAELGESLARHVDNCPECSARMATLRSNPLPLPPIPLERPWRAFAAFAAMLVLGFTAVYCVVEQFRRGR